MTQGFNRSPLTPRKPEDHFDKMFEQFEKKTGKIIKIGIGIWVAAVLVSLAFAGVIIWGIVQLVQAYT